GAVKNITLHITGHYYLLRFFYISRLSPFKYYLVYFAAFVLHVKAEVVWVFYRVVAHGLAFCQYPHYVVLFAGLLCGRCEGFVSAEIAKHTNDDSYSRSYQYQQYYM